MHHAGEGLFPDDEAARRRKAPAKKPEETGIPYGKTREAIDDIEHEPARDYQPERRVPRGHRGRGADAVPHLALPTVQPAEEEEEEEVPLYRRRRPVPDLAAEQV